MKFSSLLCGAALAAIAVTGMTTGAQARFDAFIDSGDYWRHHQRDYCYYHDCGNSWYGRHHRHHWHDRNRGRDYGGGRDGGADGDWGNRDDGDQGDDNNDDGQDGGDDNGQHHRHHDR